MVAISQYFANVGLKVDEKALKDVDTYLNKIEKRLARGAGQKGLRVNLYIDEAKFGKHLASVMTRIGKGSPLKLTNVTVDQATLAKSIRELLSKATFRAPITAVLNRASLATIRQQVSTALAGLPIYVRVGGVRGTSAGSSGNAPRGTESARRRASLTGRGDPSLQEYLGGTYAKSNLTAGNRRYTDAIVSKGFGAPPGLAGLAVQGGLGGLARMGAGNALGRGLAFGATSMFGPFAGGLALVGSGLASVAASAFMGVWKTAGAVISAPFQLIGGAASAVTSAFYRVAMAALPLAVGFNFIDTRVREQTTQGVALSTMAEQYGSTGKRERDWLMNMANRSGAEYSNIVSPFTSFISASAPSMGLGSAKSAFEAFTQYGMTHGANNFSMQNALKAFGQMSAKGSVQLEELKNQVGDAQGFGGMLPIFAQAWQTVQGKVGPNALTGQKAIAELLEATKKGLVITSKILPEVEKIARERSAASLDKIRNSSQGQRANFMNQIDQGWQNFTEGGGEAGLMKFWMMAQQLSGWWRDNGNTLGKYFELFIYDLQTMATGIGEAFSFILSGKQNDLVEIAADNGIDLVAIRDNVIDLGKGLRDIFKAASEILGIDTGEGFMVGLGRKIVAFTNDLLPVMESFKSLLIHIASFMNSWRFFSDLSWSEKMGSTVSAFVPGTRANQHFGNMLYQAGAATGSVIGATWNMGGALGNLATQPGNSMSIPYSAQGTGIRSTLPFGEWGKKYYDTVPPVPGSVASIAQGLGSSSLGFNNSAFKVDINLNVSGDPESLKLFVTNELQDVVKNRVDYSLSSAFTSALTSAAKNQ